MRDIVIDTNVLAHACNPTCEYFESALALILSMFDNDVILALDDTGKKAPANETSYLFLEYENTLPPGSISRDLLIALALSSRIEFFRRPKREQWDHCKKIIPKNPVDAIVLGTALATHDKTIITNDYGDFTTVARREAARRLAIVILDSHEHAA